jgi:hypothetical protein
MGNLEWCNMFGGCKVHILETRSFDHKPLLVRLEGDSRNKKGAKLDFCFEAKWVLEDDYQEVVRGAWGEGRVWQDGYKNMGSKLSILCNKLQQCSVELKR